MVGALLEHAARAMVVEEAEVGAEHKPVGVRLDIVGEICRIVPDIEALAQAVPVADIVGEGLVARIVQRRRKVALDGTEADDHVRQRLDGLGRLAGVLVGERVDGDVRKLLPDPLGHVVHERKHGAGVAPLPVVDRLAVVALARVEAVVLREREDGRIGRGFDPLADALDEEVASCGLVVQSCAFWKVRLPPTRAYHSGWTAAYFSGGTSG